MKKMIGLDMAIRNAVDMALAEDVGPGDVTSEHVVPEDSEAIAHITAKGKGILCGISVAERVFLTVDETLVFEPLARDGDPVDVGTKTARIAGKARSILTAERTALNFVQHLSGIATATHAAALRLSGTGTAILDTRKTLPGLRLLEKHAVKCGSGKNHRLGLFDGILIKNNHLKFAQIGEAVARARQGACALLKVEVEVETLDQLREALAAGADIIMLDNMKPEIIREAMKIIDKKALVEVSGNVTLDAVDDLARLGIDFISMGALTHSAGAVDFSLHVIKRS
jgi:nicotinate-nucleotide pyrophosphorylase (carboxylating)